MATRDPLPSDEVERQAIARFGKPSLRENELRFGKHQKIAVVLTGDKAGLWYDFSEGRGGRIGDPTSERPWRRSKLGRPSFLYAYSSREGSQAVGGRDFPLIILPVE